MWHTLKFRMWLKCTTWEFHTNSVAQNAQSQNFSLLFASENVRTIFQASEEQSFRSTFNASLSELRFGVCVCVLNKRQVNEAVSLHTAYNNSLRYDKPQTTFIAISLFHFLHIATGKISSGHLNYSSNTTLLLHATFYALLPRWISKDRF